MMKIHYARPLFVIIIISLCIVSVFGADVYVTETGSGAGTIADPASLTSALANAQENDVIHVAAGTYSGTPYVIDTSNVTLMGGYTDATFTSRDPWNAVTRLDGGGTTQCLRLRNEVDLIGNITVDGIEAFHGDAHGSVGGQTDKGGGIFVGAAPVTIRNSTITSCTGTHNAAIAFARNQGSMQTDGVDSFQWVDSCKIISNRSDHSAPLGSFEGEWLKVTNCLFKDNIGRVGAGVVGQWAGGKYLVSNCTFDGNTLYNAGDRGAAIFIDGAFGAVDKPNCKVFNCIFTNNDAGAGSVVHIGDNIDLPDQFSELLFNGNTGNNSNANLGTTYTDAPGYADAASGDFSLTSTSFALDLGLTQAEDDTVPFTDLRGAGRTIPDLGAYEYSPWLFASATPKGLENGLSWPNAMALSDAVTAYEADAEIQAIYMTEGDYDFSTVGEYIPSRSIKWVGGFDDLTTPGQITGNDPLTSPTIFDAQGLSRFINTTADSTSDLDIEGVNFVNGDALTSSGGAFYLRRSSMYYSTFTLCAFEGNVADTTGGGAFYIEGPAQLSFNDSTFHENASSSTDGGAILIAKSYVTDNISVDGINIVLDGCTITSNSSGDQGGFIYYLNNRDEAAYLTMDNCTVKYNSAANGGGVIGMFRGMDNDQTEGITIRECHFEGNTGAGGVRGAIIFTLYNGSNNVAITSSTFVGNDYCLFRTRFGSSNNWDVRGCAFRDNIGPDSNTQQMLVLQGAGDAYFENCLFAGNHMGNSQKDLLYFNDAGLASQVINCTFANNVMESGVYTKNVAAGTSNIVSNCIFAHNTVDSEGCVIGANGAVVDIDHSIFYDNLRDDGVTVTHWSGGITVGTGVVPGDATTNDASQDPLFVNSSGNTVDDLKLTAMSPAVDTGTDAGAPAYDLLGLARPQYNGYDMGALEFIQPPLPPASADPAIWTLY